MPYLKPNDRQKFGYPLNDLCKTIAEGSSGCTPGDLNYLFTMLCKAYLDRKGLNYTAINDIVGALEGAKLEFYRRIVGLYEDKKIKENGDVWIQNTNS